MFEIHCVTARTLCPGRFLDQVERVARSGVSRLILREKDLDPQAYQALASQVLEICQAAGVVCVVHNFPQVARRLGVGALHLPLPVLRTLPPEERQVFPLLGASCHSLEDVREAVALGCSYVTLGHIFPTGCKPGVPARGLGLLEEACREFPVPVYAIGGIGPKTVAQVGAAGAAGACVMSGLMTTLDPASYVEQLKKEALYETHR